MEHATGIFAHFVNGRVNGEAGGVDAVIALAELVAVEINLHEARSGDFVEHQAIRIDQEMMLRSRHARGDVRINQIVPAVMGDETVAGSEIDPLVPFGLRHFRRHSLQASFRWRHDRSSCSTTKSLKPSPAAGLQQGAGSAWQLCFCNDAYSEKAGPRFAIRLRAKSMRYGAGMANRLEMLRPRIS